MMSGGRRALCGWFALPLATVIGGCGGGGGSSGFDFSPAAEELGALLTSASTAECVTAPGDFLVCAFGLPVTLFITPPRPGNRLPVETPLFDVRAMESSACDGATGRCAFSATVELGFAVPTGVTIAFASRPESLARPWRLADLVLTGDPFGPREVRFGAGFVPGEPIIVAAVVYIDKTPPTLGEGDEGDLLADFDASIAGVRFGVVVPAPGAVAAAD